MSASFLYYKAGLTFCYDLAIFLKKKIFPPTIVVHAFASRIFSVHCMLHTLPVCVSMNSDRFQPLVPPEKRFHCKNCRYILVCVKKKITALRPVPSSARQEKGVRFRKNDYITGWYEKNYYREHGLGLAGSLIVPSKVHRSTDVRFLYRQVTPREESSRLTL